MIGHVVQLPKTKITQSVQLFLVLLLLLSFVQKNDVVRGLPRSIGEKIDTFRKYHKPPIDSQEHVEYDDIVKARRRLSAVVGMPPAPSIGINENDSGQLLTQTYRYKRVKDRSPSSARGLGPIIVSGQNSTSTTPKTLDDSDEQECILGRAHHYMAKWLNRNGTINADNSSEYCFKYF